MKHLILIASIALAGCQTTGAPRSDPAFGRLMINTGLQLMQNGRGGVWAPRPIPRVRQTDCRSYWVGNQVRTSCW